METADNIIEKKDKLDKELLMVNEDPEGCRHWQDKCFDLIQLISRSDADTRLLKAGVDLICKCCRTRTGVTHAGGYEIISPVIVSEEIRSFCRIKYDEWVTLIRQSERTYIPDYFERSAPGREQLRTLQQNFLSARSDSSVKAQKESHSFNRLLGGRG